MATLGEKIRQARKELGLTQVELGRLLGLTQNSVSLYEKGLNQPSSESLTKLSQILHVTTDYLLGTDEPSDVPVSTPSLNWTTVAEKLKKLREVRGHTMEQAAASINIAPETWQGWESGQVPIPLDALSVISKAYGVPLKYLMNGIKKKASAESTLDRTLRDVLPGLLHLRELPILGKIVAGIPIEAQEDRRGTALVREDIDGDFALDVEGDSMIGAGVHEGDQVVVRSVKGWEDVPERSMIVALVNGETTLKFLIREVDALSGDRWWLRAANPAYSDRQIDPTQDRVQGVVTAIQTVRPPHAPNPVASATPELNIQNTPAKLQQIMQKLSGLSSDQLDMVAAVVSPLIEQLQRTSPPLQKPDAAPF